MDNPSNPPDWSALPAPVDDGAANHLPGRLVPSDPLKATDGQSVDLAGLGGLTVVYAYPRTGRPGEIMPPGWDMIPGARGCTPQACAFRDQFSELKALGVDQVFGLSTQDTMYQREAAQRLHLPFTLLSDAELKFSDALRLPTFRITGATLLKRLTLILIDAKIAHVFYPVFPPDRSVDEVMDWLSKHLNWDHQSWPRPRTGGSASDTPNS